MSESVSRFLQGVIFFAVVPVLPPLVEHLALGTVSISSALLGFFFYVFLSSSGMFLRWLGVGCVALSIPLLLLTMASYRAQLPASAVAFSTLVTILVFCCHLASRFVIHLIWKDQFFPWDRKQ